jgi:hypothetical protein
MFFVKSHDWNFSYQIEIQSIDIQYMYMYFIKFGNCLNGFWIFEL